MTDQIIPVPDIAVIAEMNGAKQLLSLRDQKIRKDAALHQFGVGSGMKHQGDLYILDGEVELIRMTTEVRTITFGYNADSAIVINWGDGQIEVNATSHTYTDESPEHTIILRGTRNALTLFNCPDMQLTGIDIHKNDSLKSLISDHNRLQNIDLSNITSLEELLISVNNLTSVNVSCNLALKSMACTDNLLTHLDLSKNVLLEGLNCARNNLTDIDLTNNHSLLAGEFSDNPFIRNDSALIAFAASLPNRTGQDTGRIELVRADVPEQVCNIIQSKNYIVC